MPVRPSGRWSIRFAGTGEVIVRLTPTDGRPSSLWLKVRPPSSDLGRVRASRLWRYFEELPRRLYLVAFLTGLLIVGVAVVGASGSATARSDSRALQAQSDSRMLLEAVISDTAQAKVEITALSLQPFSAAGLALVTSQQQALVDDWKQYNKVAFRDAALPPRAARVSAEIAELSQMLVHQGSVKETPSAAELRRGAAMRLDLLSSTAGDLASLQADEHAADAARVGTQNRERALLLDGLLVTAALALLVVMVGNTSVARGGRRYERASAARESDLDAAMKVNEFEARLQRALDLSTTESRVYSVVHRAFVEAVPDVSVELLQADSSRAHFEPLVTTGDIANRHCSVPSPQDCPAAQRGAVLEFVSSQAIDACPYLQDQAEPCSAVCVPVSVAGTTVGVVHAAGEDGDVLSSYQRHSLELVARRSSDRIGMLRAFARSEVQANTDPLTGLRNRRSLEDAVARLDVMDTPYAVAFGDLDRFKMLNDVHGHGAGDQALRLFAEVLRGALRPNDLVGRYGGEEFVVVLPACSEAEAVIVLERIRDQLASAVADFGGPHFTVSFGLARAQEGETFAGLVSAADAALLDAKARGRDRVVVAGATVDGAGITAGRSDPVVEPDMVS